MLVGREAERARIGALLEAAHASRSGALLIRGEPGIGKTALLEDAREQAGDMHVLSARGLESESDLPFAGLHQLLRPALRLLDGIPAPQSNALRDAFGLAQHPGDNRFLISLACLTLLSELADERPVLCLVDDAHWLDTPSSDAIVFVARRLGAEGIALVLAARETESIHFDARDLSALDLGGLSARAAASLVEQRVGNVARSVEAALVDAGAGNALALLELASALTSDQLAGTEPLPDVLPLTTDLERMFLDRVRTLPEETQHTLLVVAADDTGQHQTVVSAARTLGLDPRALAAAEETRIVSVRGSRIEVHHPLVRSAIYQAATTSERQAVHGALADALSSDADRRAWHRAAATSRPEESVAAELEQAADRARSRSGHAVVATALERAAALSVDSDTRARRLVAAARAAWDAGQPARALGLLDRATPDVVDRQVGAELAHVRGEVQFWCGDLLEAYETLTAGAATIANVDTRKALEMLFDAANACVVAGKYDRVAQAGRQAEALPVPGSERDALLAGLLVGVGTLQEGKSASELPRLLDVVASADDFDEPRWLVWASGGAQVVGDEARAAEFMRRAVALARASARLDQLVPALASLVFGGIVEGRFAVAGEAEEGLKLARHGEMRNLTSLFLAALAWFAALRAQGDECRMYAADASNGAQETGAVLAGAVAHWALALLDLTHGRPSDAALRLASVRAPAGGHPYIALLTTPDLVEALVRTGRDVNARRELEALTAFTEAGGPSWSHALEARCRALLAKDEDAESAFEDAIRLHAESDRPFDRARTHLLYGEFLRRERRRTDAREQLRTSLATFEHLGATAWAARANAELRASGETARKRTPSTIGELTPQELQIAHFVAEGLSNKEVAAQLFLSPRTIDYHLRNVFSKLGITSRTQLAALVVDEREAAVAVPASVTRA